MPINTNLLEEALAKLTKGTVDALATQQKPISVTPPQAQDTASKISKQASNLEQRMVNQGIDPSQFTDKRNIIEKGLNLTPNQNVLFDIFEVINRPQQAIFGAIEEATSGGNAAEGFAQGLAGTAKTEEGQKHYYSGGQILRNIFMGGKEETGELDWTDIAGFGLDVFADPADLLLFKASSIAKATKALGKQATKLDKLFDVASEGIEKFGLYKTAMSKADEAGEILDETIKAATKVDNAGSSLLDKIKDSFTLVRPEELAADVKLAPSTLTMRAIFGTGKAALGITDEALEASTKYFGKGQDYASIKNFVQEFFNKGGSISQDAITKMRLVFGGEVLAKQYMDEAISVTNDIVNNWAEKFSIEPKALDKMFAEYWSVTLGKQSANVKDLLLGVKRRTTIPYSPEFFEELSAYFKKGTNPTDFLKVVELDGDKFIVIKELKANVLIPDAATKKVDIPQLIGADRTESILKYNEKYPEFEKAFTDWKDQYVRMREGLSTIMQNDYGIGTEYLRNVLTDDAKLARNQIDEVNKKFTDMFSDSTKTIGDPRLFTSKKYMADPITASKWLKAQRMVDTLDRVDTILRDAAELSANSRLAQTVASEVNGLFEGSNININKTIRQILDSMMLEEDGKADLLAKFRTIAEEEFGKTEVKKQLDALADKLGFTDDTVPVNITEKRFTLAGKKANTLGELLDPEEYNELVALKKNNPEALKERLRPEVFDAIGEKTVNVPKKVAPVNKQAQLDIINSTNPAQNSINTWIRKLEDIKTFDEVADASQDLAPDYTKEMVSKAKTSGKITVYSSKPIENGNFVTPSKIEAENYAGTGNKIYSKEVNVSDVAWIDGIEGQYAKASATQAAAETTAKKVAPVAPVVNKIQQVVLNDEQAKLAKEIGLDAGESVEKGIEAARNKYGISILANEEVVSIKQKTIKNYSAGRNADLTEMISVDDLKPYVELDRIDSAVPLGWKKGQTVKSTEQYFTDLANDIRENGFTEPLIIEVNPKTGFAKLGEGNHRYAVSKLLGIDEVPVRVVRNNSISPSKARGGWFVNQNEITGFRIDFYGDKYFFDEMKPSQIGFNKVLTEDVLTTHVVDSAAKKALDKFAKTEYNEATKYVDPEGKYLVGGEHGRIALTANEDMLSLTKKGYILITDNGGILINKVPTVEQLKALEDPIRFAKTDKLIIEFGFETPAYKTETINIKGKTPKQVTDEIKRFIKTDKTIIDKAVNSANASQVALDIIEQRISEKAKFLISDSTLIKTLRDKLVASEKYTIDEINQLTSPEGIKQLNTYLEDIMVKNEDNVRDYVKKSAEWLNNTQAQEVFEVSVLGSMVDLMEKLPRTIKSARLFDVILGPTFADIGSANSPIQWIPFEKQVVSAIKDEAGNVVKKVEKRIFPKAPPGFKKLEHPQQFVDKIREMNKFVESDELNKVADWIESSIDKSVQSADGTIVKMPGIIAIEANMIRHLELDYNKVSNSLLKIADFSNSLFKRNKLLSPGFNARNVLGIYTNLSLGDIMPDEAGRKMISGLEVFKQGPGLLRRATTENLQKVLAGESTQFTAEEVNKLRLYTEYIKGGLTPPKSLKQTLKDGLTGSGSELMDLENVGKELENLEGKLPDWITKSKEFADKVSIANGWVNETVDALGRMVVLQKALDEPDYLIKLGVKNPIDAVRLVMFDNKNLSTYEQEIGKRVIPFYSFAKQNLAFHMKNLPNNTPIYNKFYKGIKSAWRAIGINDEDLEDYKMEQMYIPIPALTKDGKYYAIKANLPQSEVGEFLSNPLKKITASTTPLIRAPFELAANKSIFTGREIEEFEGQQSTQLPFLTRKQEYLVGQTGIDVPLKVVTGAFDVLSMRNPVKGALQMSNIIQEGSVQAGKTNAAYEKLNALQNGVKLLKQKDIDLQTLAQQEKQITTEKLNNVQQILSQIGK